LVKKEVKGFLQWGRKLDVVLSREIILELILPLVDFDPALEVLHVEEFPATPVLDIRKLSDPDHLGDGPRRPAQVNGRLPDGEEPLLGAGYVFCYLRHLATPEHGIRMRGRSPISKRYESEKQGAGYTDGYNPLD
jgi:hypothetical protein